MQAIYRGKLATITECMGNPHPTGDKLWDMDGAVLDGDLWVSFWDPGLIVDPTDDQVAAARAGEPIPPDPVLEAFVQTITRDLLTGRISPEQALLRIVEEA